MDDDGGEWEVLADDLRARAIEHEATPGRPSKHGQKHEVDGPLTGPNGRTASVTVVWMVRRGENVRRLTTAYPGAAP